MARERDNRLFIVLLGPKDEATGGMVIDPKDVETIQPGWPCPNNLSPVIRGLKSARGVADGLEEGSLSSDKVLEIRELGAPVRRISYRAIRDEVDLVGDGDEQQEQEA